MKTKYGLYASVMVLSAAMAACGGGGGSSSPPPPPVETLFTAENAWVDPIPSAATQISEDEFRKAIVSGKGVIVSATSLQKQKDARDQAFRDNKAYLTAIANPSAALTALLKEAEAITTDPGDRQSDVLNGPVQLGLGERLKMAVRRDQLGKSADSLMGVYTLTYGLLPADLQAKIASPDSLKGSTLEQLTLAQAKLDELTGSIAALDGTYRQSAPNPSPSANALSAAKISLMPKAGNALGPYSVLPTGGGGLDATSSCAPRGYAATYWFPLKKFVSPTKDQAQRGVCWSFAALGAVESRERVQNNNPVNLSEQFLVNKVKLEWGPSEVAEGGSADFALSEAVKHNQLLAQESQWTYNGAAMRTKLANGEPDGYKNVCNSYTGSCSETTHESAQQCTTSNGKKFCMNQVMELSGSIVAGTTTPQAPQVTSQVWPYAGDKDADPVVQANKDQLSLARLRNLLAQGHVLMTAFPLYRGFDEVLSNVDRNGNPVTVPFAGILINYNDETCDKNGNCSRASRGDHVAQIIGFLSNDITGEGAGGGGLFVLKNSWGCGYGDSGYAYIPADYFFRYFHEASILNFDSTRSAAWNGEQNLPGSAPAITVPNASVNVDLRVKTDLAGLFNVTHPIADDVALTVTSNVLGKIYDGGWSTARNLLIGPSFRYTFNSEGTQTLTIVARNGTASSSATVNINVVNSPPVIKFVTSGLAYQGEAYPIALQLSDINEPDSTQLCAVAHWTVNATDTITDHSGCAQTVTFASAGIHTVDVSTFDRETLTTTKTLQVDVQPAPVNPFPRIKTANVKSSEFTSSGIFKFCSSVNVANGATINLRNLGCSLLIGQPAPPRYSVAVDVENPSNEMLAYEWNLYITGATGVEVNAFPGPFSTGSNTATLFSPGNQTQVTDFCRVTVDVKAPDPTRNKTQLVWSGMCTLLVGILN